jgi:histidinol-phosphate/aromatic aminotransferase/cobyric acid decarboxylase-like protein
MERRCVKLAHIVTDDAPFLSATVRGLPVFAGVPTADSLAREGSFAQPVLLHLNECPYPPSPRVVEAIGRSAAGANRYAEPRPDALAAALAVKTGVSAANIVLGNGSDEILALVCQMALAPGDSAVMPTPSFPRYRLGTRMMGAEPRLVRNRDDGRNDVAGLLGAIDRSTRLVFACTPNNPSGAPLPRDEVRALVEGVPDDVLLVMDEAYYEFDAAEGGEGALDELRRRRGPWLSTRTMSKAYAIAGLRVGYGLASSRERRGRLAARQAELQPESPRGGGRAGSARRRSLFEAVHGKGHRRTAAPSPRASRHWAFARCPRAPISFRSTTAGTRCR